MGSCERDPQKDNGNDPIPSTIIKQNHRLKNWGSESGNISTFFFFFFCLIKLQWSTVTSFFFFFLRFEKICSIKAINLLLFFIIKIVYSVFAWVLHKTLMLSSR